MLGMKKKAKTDVATQEQQAPVANASTEVATQQTLEEPQVPTQDVNMAANVNVNANTNVDVNQTTNVQDPNAVGLNGLPQQNGKARIRQPLKSYNYTIINGVGKKEKGSFDAES